MKYFEFPVISSSSSNNANEIKLDLKPITDEELPKVSIVTITRNREDFISLMARNYSQIDYPREKLEWVIVDDSSTKINYKALENLGARIIRVPKEGPLKIGRKRNFVNCLTKTDYIVHMDDDDYYPSYSVVSRIRTLLAYEKIINSPGCVGCRKVNCYDLITDKTFEAYDALVDTVSESTLAYSKKFWLQQGFCNDDTVAECIKFIGSREICVVPSSYVITQFTHNTNTITRRPVNNSTFNFMDLLTMYDINIINEIKSKLVMKMPEYKHVIAFVKTILSVTKDQRLSFEQKQKKIVELFNDLEQSREHRDLIVLKNPLVLNIRFENVVTKKKSSGKDIVYYCGPSTILGHQNEWNPESKTLGGSEEAVVNLSRTLVKLGYNVTVYNVLEGPSKKYDGVLYKGYWLWNPKDKQDITIIWRDPSIIKEVPFISSDKIFLDMHDAIPVNEESLTDAIFVKSNFHKTFVNSKNNIVVVPNGIQQDLLKEDIKDPNMAICTSSPDRCLNGLLDALPIIRTFNPDFTVYWAYGFKAGINKGGIAEDTRPEVSEWYTNLLEKIKTTEGFINLDRLSQEEIRCHYKKATYFIYGTIFPEIDCISLTKALYYNCIPLVAGTGSIPEKMKALNKPFIDTTPVIQTGIDTSLQKDNPLFNDWISLISNEINKNKNSGQEHKDSEDSKDSEESLMKYDWNTVTKQWAQEIKK